jgi:hypothetical protein
VQKKCPCISLLLPVRLSKAIFREVDLEVMLKPSEHDNVPDLLSGKLHAQDFFGRLILIQLANQFPTFYGSGRFIIVLKNSTIGLYEERVGSIPHLHI